MNEFCGAKKRQGEGTCTQPAGWGTPNSTGACKLHGGKTANHRAAAQEKQARALAVTLGAPIEVDPRDSILQMIYWSAGHCQYLRQKVQEIDPDALVNGTRSVQQVTKEGFQEGVTLAQEAGPDIHLWLRLYGEE